VSGSPPLPGFAESEEPLDKGIPGTSGAANGGSRERTASLETSPTLGSVCGGTGLVSEEAVDVGAGGSALLVWRGR